MKYIYICNKTEVASTHLLRRTIFPGQWFEAKDDKKKFLSYGSRSISRDLADDLLRDGFALEWEGPGNPVPVCFPETEGEEE